jgi:hypothetical protein
VIAEVLESAYDFQGERTSIPGRRVNRCFHPTFPMGRYLSQPLGVVCGDLEDVRGFLRTCRYVSDETQFGRNDYWQPPEEFELRKAGDCEDWALWAWRQLLALGYDTRFVVGRSGRYGDGHAWLTLELNGRCCLLEPQLASLGPQFPRLSAVRYYPEVSVGWDGNRAIHFKHRQRAFSPSLRQAIGLVAEWLVFWLRFWARFLFQLPSWLGRRLVRRIS